MSIPHQLAVVQPHPPRRGVGGQLTTIGEMVDRVQDAEEKVRAALCHVFGQLDYETALHHIDVETLRAIGGRVSDKKASSAFFEQ